MSEYQSLFHGASPLRFNPGSHYICPAQPLYSLSYPCWCSEVNDWVMRPWFDFITAVLTWPSIAQPWVILLGVTYSKQVRTGGHGGCRREKGNYSFHAFGSSWLPLGRRPGAGERGEKRAIWAAPDPRPLRVTGLGSIAPSPGINHDLEPASQAGQG